MLSSRYYEIIDQNLPTFDENIVIYFMHLAPPYTSSGDDDEFIDYYYDGIGGQIVDKSLIQNYRL